MFIVPIIQIKFIVSQLPLLDNKYKVLQILGSGGFGKVLLAYDEFAKHEVAIKTYINTEFTDEDIKREIQFLASLKHPSIVTFYHHFIHDSMLHIVMEYCIGGSLYDLLSSDKYEIDQAVELCIKIADALSYIHNKGIIHHDIKPANILFDENKNPKLSDFGVSNTRGGTYSYLPPEVFFSEYITSGDPKIDIYSLGIVLLEIIIGHNPFKDIPKKDIIAAKLNHTFVPSDLPHWLQEIILKSTHPSPELRFQSAQEFSSALKARCVPYTLNKENIKADKFFTYAAKSLSQKKWHKAKNYIDEGFDIAPDSVLGNITAGKYYLKTYKLNLAKKHFEKALNINPGVDIKKELSEIHLDEGNYPQAISLLQNHIQLNPIDWEAYNLLAESYYRMNRFELALEIFDSIIKDAKHDCFWNNLVITHLSNGSLNRSVVSEAMNNSLSDCFITFNRSVYKDSSKSWSEPSLMKKKFLYQSYRFNKLGNNNQIKIESSISNITFTKPIISIGRNDENDFVIDDITVSRRHCAIINYEKDVWIYDLGSTTGVFVDDQKINNKYFLIGKHKITIGNFSFELYSNSEKML